MFAYLARLVYFYFRKCVSFVLPENLNEKHPPTEIGTGVGLCGLTLRLSPSVSLPQGTEWPKSGA